MAKYCFFLALSLMFFSSPLSAQGQETEDIFVIVEEMPQFKGGEAKLYEFLGNAIKYPEAARKDSITGVVYVSFVVGADGLVKDPMVIKGAHKLLDEEALRAIKLMPAWTPGLQKGKPVNVQYNLPIRFTL